MTTVVISQPMLFPWVGLFEQAQLADVFVHYVDVQFAKGFINRVQLKTASGAVWLSIPLTRASRLSPIDGIEAAESDWRERQRCTLLHALSGTPHRADVLAVVDELFARDHRSVSAFLTDSFETIHDRLGLPPTRFASSAGLASNLSSSARLLSIVQHFGGTTYVTGHGARRYLDHAMFERAGVSVEYMRYAMTPYPQRHGTFDPFVSVLDLAANVGFAGASAYLRPQTVGWSRAWEQSLTPSS